MCTKKVRSPDLLPLECNQSEEIAPTNPNLQDLLRVGKCINYTYSLKAWKDGCHKRKGFAMRVLNRMRNQRCILLCTTTTTIIKALDPILGYPSRSIKSSQCLLCLQARILPICLWCIRYRPYKHNSLQRRKSFVGVILPIQPLDHKTGFGLDLLLGRDFTTRWGTDDRGFVLESKPETFRTKGCFLWRTRGVRYCSQSQFTLSWKGMLL